MSGGSGWGYDDSGEDLEAVADLSPWEEVEEPSGWQDVAAYRSRRLAAEAAVPAMRQRAKELDAASALREVTEGA